MTESTFKSERKVLRAELRKRFPRQRGQLLPALHYLQHEFGYLPEWGMEVVGWHLAIPASEVYGAATSYTELRTHEPGNHLIRVCSGLGCWVNGGRDILQDLISNIGIQPDETTSDNKFTLEEIPCTYICAMAPVVEINGQLVGRASRESVSEFVEEIKNNGQ